MNPNWRDGAACYGLHNLMDDPGHSTEDNAHTTQYRQTCPTCRTHEQNAKRICNACPVLRDCLQWALLHDVGGVCGGWTEEERETWREEHKVSLSSHADPWTEHRSERRRDRQLLAAANAAPISDLRAAGNPLRRRAVGA